GKLPAMATPSRSPGPSRSPRPHGRRSAGGGDTTDLREAILAATAGLLADRQFGDLAVGDILTAAGVSRGTFYFYFDSKHDVLAELVRRAVARGHDAAAPWLAVPADPAAALRTGITAGAQLWRQSAPVLRAIVENWRTDPRLEALWAEQMQTFTDATVAQINADPVRPIASGSPASATMARPTPSGDCDAERSTWSANCSTPSVRTQSGCTASEATPYSPSWIAAASARRSSAVLAIA